MSHKKSHKCSDSEDTCSDSEKKCSDSEKKCTKSDGECSLSDDECSLSDDECSLSDDECSLSDDECSLSDDSSSSSSSSSHKKYNKKKHSIKCCKRMLYSIGAWADNSVTEINFVPKYGVPIVWTAPTTLSPSNPSNTNHWNMQSPITQSTFPIFPLKINCGDKFIFTFNNDSESFNAFACAANIDGIIYRTANNTTNLYPNKITLQPSIGFSIVNPSYAPITDLPTRNIIDSINYISVSPNNTTNYTLTWEL